MKSEKKSNTKRSSLDFLNFDDVTVGGTMTIMLNKDNGYMFEGFNIINGADNPSDFGKGLVSADNVVYNTASNPSIAREDGGTFKFYGGKKKKKAKKKAKKKNQKKN